MRRSWLIAAILAWAQPAAAHDFWLQPMSFTVLPKAPLSMTIEVGHGPDRVRSSVTADRIITLRSIGPEGIVDHKGELRSGAGSPDIRMSFPAPGTYVVELETNHAQSILPAIRFNDYLKAEGLTPALQYRLQNKQVEADGREIYSRRAKTIIEVGKPNPSLQSQVTRPLGMSLEIVPERDPYSLKPGESLTVQVIFEGHPLPGALIMLTNLNFDFRPISTQLTDAAGHATFMAPHDGSWLLNVLWTKPIKGDPRADFETTFSSLTFGRS